MNKDMYTYADILVSPYEFEKVLELQLTEELSEHSELYITGTVPEDKIDKYVENASDSEWIEVHLKGEDKNNLLFQGVVSNISINAKMDVRTITIKALSTTSLMDITKKRRSFQDENNTYSKVFTEVEADYKDSFSGSKDKNSGEKTFEDSKLKSKKPEGLLVQYDETDWEFIKRLASHFYIPLIPALGYKGLKYYIGIPENQDSAAIERYNYSMTKDLENYRINSKNDLKDIDEQDLISYEVVCNEVLNLGSLVSFKGKSLYVFKAVIQMKDSGFENTYILRNKKGFSQRTIYNYSIVGVSLFGKVLKVINDTVKIKLDIDGKQDEKTARPFPYSTVYSSEDGSGWYCMPEIGDKVRLYFPTKEEKDAIASSSVNLKSTDAQKRNDPSVKSITTKYGKQILFKPGAIEIISNEKLLMRITDDGGIEVQSNKKISLNAKEDIEINGGSNILIQGDKGVNLKQADADINIADSVSLSGSKVNIQ